MLAGWYTPPSSPLRIPCSSHYTFPGRLLTLDQVLAHDPDGFRCVIELVCSVIHHSGRTPNYNAMINIYAARALSLK